MRILDAGQRMAIRQVAILPNIPVDTDAKFAKPPGQFAQEISFSPTHDRLFEVLLTTWAILPPNRKMSITGGALEKLVRPVSTHP